MRVVAVLVGLLSLRFSVADPEVPVQVHVSDEAVDETSGSGSGSADQEEQAENVTTKKRRNITRKKLVKGLIPLISEEEEPDFLVPEHLEPGEMAPVVWRDDGKRQDKEGYMIGLPPELTEEINKYCEEAGLLELSRKLLYDDPVSPGENRLYKLKDGTNWGAMGPTQWKKGDLTWIDSADEETYEKTLEILGRGGFDQVLDAIGKKFNLDGLMIHGVGLIVVSHFPEKALHYDLDNTDHSFFNVIFPLQTPSHGDARLKLGDDQDKDSVGSVSFRHNLGVVLGGETKHGTAKCDYRETEEFRVSIAIYMADVNMDNVEQIASDSTSLFPTENDEEWFLAQAGRVWGDGNSLAEDKGRKPYGVEDNMGVDCTSLAESGKCETDLMGTRMKCQKSCKVYMEDELYYELFEGVEEEL